MTWDELDEAENACDCGNWGYDVLEPCPLCHEKVCSLCEGFHVSRECVEGLYGESRRVEDETDAGEYFREG